MCSIQHYVCQWLAVGRWFSPGTLVSSTNKTDSHDIADTLLKVALNTPNPNESGYFTIACHVFSAIQFSVTILHRQ
jgi:hypothetical protein